MEISKDRLSPLMDEFCGALSCALRKLFEGYTAMINEGTAPRQLNIFESMPDVADPMPEDSAQPLNKRSRAGNPKHHWTKEEEDLLLALMAANPNLSRYRIAEKLSEETNLPKVDVKTLNGRIQSIRKGERRKIYDLSGNYIGKIA